MYFVQFYTKGAISGEPTEACGDRAVVILDGRESRDKMNGFSLVETRRRNYCGYRLFKGESFIRSTPIANYMPVK